MTGDGQCSAKAKSTGNQCRQPAIPGGTVCRRYHGGGAPQVKAKAEQRLAEARAQGMLTRLGAEPCTNPLQALAEVTGEVLRFKTIMSDTIDEMTRIRFTDDKGAEQLRAEVAVYERALDRCGTFLVNMAKLNIEERMARITEAQLEIFDRALTAALNAAGLGERATEVKGHAARHLRSVSS